MYLNIIQLTDIHFSKNHENYIVNRRELLFRGILSEARGSAQLIILVTGDIANYGIASEYNEIALDFFSTLKEELEEELKNKVDFVFLPGNHDCDFSNAEKNQVREAVVNGVRAAQFIPLSETLIEAIIMQDPFDDFKEIFHTDWEYCKKVVSHPLLNVIKVDIEFEKSIYLHLYNSSWLTNIKETPGSLYMPVNLLAEKIEVDKSSIVISAVHHPDHWLQPNNKREWINFLEENSQFIFTGHEHVDSIIEKTNWKNKKVHYIEGRSLQDLYEKDNSGFNSLKINLKNFSFRVNHYQLSEGKIYEKFGDSIEKEIQITSKFGKNIELKSSFLERLKDIGIPLTHPRKKDLNLNDLYIIPDVQEILHQNEKQSTLVDESIYKVLEDDRESLLFITGDNESGKTSLAKYITNKYLNDGIFPLLIKGEDVKADFISNIDKLIDRYSFDIFKNESIETYKQLKRSERTLIIDDWHNSPINSKLKQDFIKNACVYFKQIIFLAEINSNITEAIKLIPGHDEYRLRHFQLLEFGHLKQDELLTKWITLGQEDTISEEKLIKEKDTMYQSLRPIISNGMVPRYPVYLLITLKAVENGQPHDLSKSSNGYYFEVLIKDALNSIEIKNKDLDKLYTYLACFAAEISISGERKISIDNWRIFHNEHLRYHDLEEDQLNLIEYRKKLLDNKIIKQENDYFFFNHNYIYYYFVAQYYASRIGQREIRDRIKIMCQNLQHEEYANIIMFLTHLSKEELIIDEVLVSARSLYAAVEPIKLNDDIKVLNDLIDEVYDYYVKSEIDVVQYRRQQNELKDTNERRELLAQQETAAAIENEEDAQTVMQRMDDINKGFKIMEITGQILKNYYGSLSSLQKTLLCEELFQLAFRLIHSFILDLKEHHEQIISMISTELVEKGQEADSKEAEKFAKRLVFRLAGFIIYKTMLKVGLCVGSIDLDKTYKKVMQSLDYHTSNLTYIGIKLDYYEHFPLGEVTELFKDIQDNPMARTILQQQVKRYLYMFPTSFSEKQQYCSAVRLNLSPSEKYKIMKKS